jgi:hypothetical protein
MSAPDFSQLGRATADVAAAAADNDAGPADPRDYNELRARLVPARMRLPPLYRDTVYDPYLATLEQLGDSGFRAVLQRDPDRQREAGLMLDIAQAILQQAEDYAQQPTDAYQEVISDLYDGFLSAEDRRGVKPPDQSVIAPLVKWGEPANGPYTWPVDPAAAFGLKTGIVSMPPGTSRRGILAWAALGHETAGHDIMGADTGLSAEMQQAVGTALLKAGLGRAMADYWAERIDETASDVMGILNMGPAAAIALICFLRAFVGGTLRNRGPAADPHPADVVRGYLGAEVVRLLNFSDHKAWADAITAETDHDCSSIQLATASITRTTARKAAAIVAKALVSTRLAALEDHALGDIQNWADHDEAIVATIAGRLKGTSRAKLPAAAYAAHVVAAGCVATLGSAGSVATIFERSLGLMKTMHDENPSWGPLYVAHPGDFGRHRAVEPTRA